MSHMYAICLYICMCVDLNYEFYRIYARYIRAECRGESPNQNTESVKKKFLNKNVFCFGFVVAGMLIFHRFFVKHAFKLLDFCRQIHITHAFHSRHKTN